MAEETPLQEPMLSYVRRFRSRVLDNNPLKNVLNNYEEEFTENEIVGWVEESWYMINEAEPRTNYRLDNFPKTALLLDGAMMKMMEAKGLLHLRNQLSYNDAGFSVNLDDKSGFYAQWLSQKATVFFQDLKTFKRSKVPRFRGVDSPMRFW
jgi:hypothetical protein